MSFEKQMVTIFFSIYILWPVKMIGSKEASGAIIRETEHFPPYLEFDYFHDCKDNDTKLVTPNSKYRSEVDIFHSKKY